MHPAVSNASPLLLMPEHLCISTHAGKHLRNMQDYHGESWLAPQASKQQDHQHDMRWRLGMQACCWAQQPNRNEIMMLQKQNRQSPVLQSRLMPRAELMQQQRLGEVGWPVEIAPQVACPVAHMRTRLAELI